MSHYDQDQQDFDDAFQTLAVEHCDCYYDRAVEDYQADATEWKNIPWNVKKSVVAAYLRTDEGQQDLLRNISTVEVANAIDDPLLLAASIRESADLAMNLYWNENAEEVAATAFAEYRGASRRAGGGQ